MFFCFFNISIRTRCFCFGWRICSFRAFTLFHWTFLFHLLKKSGVLVFPVTNCPWNGNDALYSAVIYKSTCCFYSCHFSIIIWFVIVGKLNQFTVFQSQACSRISWICAISWILGDKANTRSTSRLKCKTFNFFFFWGVQLGSRASHSLFHLQNNTSHFFMAFFID